MLKTRPFDEMRFVAFAVNDLESARAFYVNQLGLPVVDEEPGRLLIVDSGGLFLRISASNPEIC